MRRKLFSCVNEPFVRGYPAERGSGGALLGETPNRLSASATLADGDRKCQSYFASRRFPLRRRHLPFSQAQFSSGLYATKLTANSCIARCSSKNAVSFSSARTMKRPAISRSAATTQNCRPSSFVLEIQPQLHPALLRLSAMISQYFTDSPIPEGLLEVL